METAKGYEKYIGKRIKDEIKQRRGTVRWIGDLNINNTNNNQIKQNNNQNEEKWAGIEWDKAEDGTHRGEYKGVQYFECQSKASTASFLKFSKLNFGRSFLDSLAAKYQVTHKKFSEEKEEKAFVYTVEGRKVEIEFVGEDEAEEKSSQYSKKQIISLPNFDIAFSSLPLSSFPPFHQIKELDLSDNLLTNWAEISKITCEMPTLKSLNLSGNFLDFSTLDQSLSFPRSLDVLVLNRMRLSWLSLNKIEEKMGGAKELHISFNEFGNCDQPINAWLKLETLNIEGNFIENWENFSLAVGHFPLLSKVILNRNPLSSLSPPLPLSLHPSYSSFDLSLYNFNFNNNDGDNDGGDSNYRGDNIIIEDNNNNKIIITGENNNKNENNQTEKINYLLEGLKSISLAETNISEWNALNHLHFYPNFCELNISSVPLYNLNLNSLSYYRLMTIARIANLKILNRSEISIDERENSEKSYLSSIHSLKGKSERHPDMHRYDELISIFGMPSDTIRSLRTQFIELQIWSEVDEEVGKKLPTTTSIAKLKAIIGRLYSLKPSLLSLFFHRKKGELAIEPLDDDERTLEYYGITSEGFIFVKYPFNAAKSKPAVDPFSPVVF